MKVIPKFTHTQISYLKWLMDGNHISICIELCNKLGEVYYSSPLPFKADARALFNLYRDGFIETNDEYSFGIRWMVAVLSSKGQSAMEKIND